MKKIHDVDQIVGQNIRTIRTARRMSQTTLGEQIGVTFQQVQKYERGTNRVSASKLVEIAATLHCNVTDLFAGTNMQASEEDRPTHMSREAITIARLFDELPPRQRLTMRKLLESIVQQEVEAMVAA